MSEIPAINPTADNTAVYITIQSKCYSTEEILSSLKSKLDSEHSTDASFIDKISFDIDRSLQDEGFSMGSGPSATQALIGWLKKQLDGRKLEKVIEGFLSKGPEISEVINPSLTPNEHSFMISTKGYEPIFNLIVNALALSSGLMVTKVWHGDMIQPGDAKVIEGSSNRPALGNPRSDPRTPPPSKWTDQ